MIAYHVRHYNQALVLGTNSPPIWVDLALSADHVTPATSGDFVPVTGDVKQNLDGVNVSGVLTMTNVAAGQLIYEASGGWRLELLAGETQAREVLVIIRDQGGSPVIDPVMLVIHTVGSTSGMFPDNFYAAIVGSVQADTDDLQARLPATLNGGLMRSSVESMLANVVTATALAAAAITAIQSGLATSGGVAGVQSDTDALQTDTAALLGRLTSARAGYLDNLNPAPPTAAAINTALGAAHGTGAWGGSGGGGGGIGSGLGIFPVTVRAEDGAAVGIPDVAVQVYDVDGVTAVTDAWWTQADGEYEFMLNEGSYLLRVRSSPRYATVPDQAFTVDSGGAVSAGSATVALTAWAPALPTAPSVCRVWLDTREMGVGVAEGVVAKFRPSFGGAIEAGASFLTVTRERTLTTGSDGRGWVDLPWSSQLDPVDGSDVQWQVTSEELRLKKKFTLPSVSSISVGELIS